MAPDQHLRLPEVRAQDEVDDAADRGGRSPWRRLFKIVSIALGIAVIIGGVSAVLFHGKGMSQTRIATLLSGTDAQQAVHVSETITGLGPRQVQDGYIDFASNRSSFVTKGGLGGETRRIGADAWTSALPGFGLPEGKKWLHLPKHDRGNLLGSGDPRDILDRARSEGGQPVELSGTTIAGRRVRHYSIKGPDRDASHETIDVYIGDDGLLRRLVEARQLPEGSTVVFQMDVIDYTAPVVVEAPPADEVVEFNDLAQGKLSLDTCTMAKSSLATSHLTPIQKATLLAAACPTSNGHG